MADALGRRDSVSVHQLVGAILAKHGVTHVRITEADLAAVAGETLDITSSRTDRSLPAGVYVVERTLPRPAGPLIIGGPGHDDALRRGPQAGGPTP